MRWMVLASGILAVFGSPWSLAKAMDDGLVGIYSTGCYERLHAAAKSPKARILVMEVRPSSSEAGRFTVESKLYSYWDRDCAILEEVSLQRQEVYREPFRLIPWSFSDESRCFREAARAQRSIHAIGGSWLENVPDALISLRGLVPYCISRTTFPGPPEDLTIDFWPDLGMLAWGTTDEAGNCAGPHAGFTADGPDYCRVLRKRSE